MERKEVQYPEIYRICEKYFLDLEDPVLVTKNAKFFTEGYDAYGLTEDQIRTLKKRLIEEYEIGPHEASEMGLKFLKTGKYEFGSLAIMLLKKFRPRFDRFVFEQVSLWLEQGIENWAHTDYLCTKVTPVFLELGIIELEDLSEWRTSSSKWMRRAVPVTMLYLKRTVDPKVLLEFLAPMMREKEQAVQQGLGWFLKKLWVIHPKEVEEFLHHHKKTASRLIIQGATEKMSKERRKRFRKPQ